MKGFGKGLGARIFEDIGKVEEKRLVSEVKTVSLQIVTNQREFLERKAMLFSNCSHKS